MEKRPKYSIIIGTYGQHLEDCLKPCVESILKYTTLNDFSTELIIVANGCTDNTREYVESLQAKFHNIRLLWFDEGLGFSGAYNEGLKIAQGDYIVLFNNDNILLDQPYNKWLQELAAPFEKDVKVGVTGPMKEHCPHADRDFILFFCAMLSRESYEAVGLIDTAFGAGYGEDADYSCKLEDLGYKVVQVPDESHQFYGENRRTGIFPLYHAGNKTFKDWPGGEELLANNNRILEERYGKKKSFVDVIRPEQIKYNIAMMNLLPMIERAKTCDGWISDDELMFLATSAKGKKTLLECGSWHGKSARAIADNMDEGAVLYCVDSWNGSAGEQDTSHASARMKEGDHAFYEFLQNHMDLIQAGKVVPLRLTTKNASDIFKEKGMKFDFIFIDAGHLYHEIKEDILNFQPLLNEGAIFCGHDYQHVDGIWAGVTQAVDELLVAHRADLTNIWVSTGEKKTPIVVVNSKVNIYDCFPFFNELDVLDIRFAELYNVVDRFVITEATKTHAGKDKPLYFKDNLQRYAKYLDKVTHIVVTEYPALDPWSIERHQRDELMRGLTECKDSDIIIMSDADEIPRGGCVYEFKHQMGTMGLIQKMYYYKLNCQATQDWDWAKIASYKDVKAKSPCGVRYTRTIGGRDTIKDGGWHFSYLSGSTEGIIQKIEATAHQEYNLPEIKDVNRVENIVKQGKDLYDRPLLYTFVEIDESYPKYITDNLEAFKEKGLVSDVFSVVL